MSELASSLALARRARHYRHLIVARHNSFGQWTADEREREWKVRANDETEARAELNREERERESEWDESWAEKLLMRWPYGSWAGKVKASERKSGLPFPLSCPTANDAVQFICIVADCFVRRWRRLRRRACLRRLCQLTCEAPVRPPTHADRPTRITFLNIAPLKTLQLMAIEC